MRILLVDILRTSLEEVWPSAEHSLGLLYLAGALKRAHGGRISLRIRTLVSKPSQPGADTTAMLRHLEEWRPDVVGFRCLTIGKDALHAAAAIVKEWDPACFVIAGGPYGTDDPESALRDGAVDCVVIGEGEATAADLVGRLLDRTPIGDVAGLAFRRGGRVLRTAPRALIADLDDLPLPDYSLIDLDAFSNRFLTFSSKISHPHGNIMTTRGCPYQCAYCHNILGKKFRTRSPEGVYAEIRYLHDRYGLTDFQIVDDIFNLDLERAKRICELIINGGLKLTLSFPNALRGDRVDLELVDKLAAAGTKFISYAVETASPRLQKLIQKNLDLDKTFRAIEDTAKAGIITRGFFMLGFPTETEEELLRTIEYAKASSLCGATFFTVVYFPGTRLYDMARSLGYFQDDGYDVQRDYVQVGEGPYDFSLETLKRLKTKAIREFAFTRERIENALRVLPAYFTPREIDGFFMAYIVSSQLTLDEVEDAFVKATLRRHFVVADRFSKRGEFYV